MEQGSNAEQPKNIDISDYSRYSLYNKFNINFVFGLAISHLIYKPPKQHFPIILYYLLIPSLLRFSLAVHV